MEWLYERREQEIVITGCRGEEQELCIPDALEGLPVRVIGRNAFNGCHTLRAVKLGRHMEAVEPYAFFYCTALKSLQLNEGLREIGDSAFLKCPIEELLLPASLQHLGKKAFQAMENYDDFPQKLQIAEGNRCFMSDGHGFYERREEGLYLRCAISQQLKSFRSFAHDVRYEVAPGTVALEEKCFANCRNLCGVQLPQGLKRIGARAFEDCLSLSGICLPEGLESIGEEAFLNSNIASFHLPDSLRELGEGAFASREQWGERRYRRSVTVGSQNPLYEGKDARLLYTGKAGEKRLLADFNSDDRQCLPTELTAIGSKAFYNSSVQELHLPLNIRSIHPEAFSKCNRLRRLILEGPGERSCIVMPGAKGAYDVKPIHEQAVACIRSGDDGSLFDYESYDSLFPSVSDKREKILMAANRLKSDVRLEQRFRRAYLQYLQRHAAAAVQTVVEFDELESLHALAELGIFTAENMDTLIELANRAGKADVLSYLLNYKNANMGMTEEDYEL